MLPRNLLTACLFLAAATALFSPFDDNCPCHGMNCSCSATFPQYCGHNDMCSCIDKTQTCCGSDGTYCDDASEVCSDCPYNPANPDVPCTRTSSAHFADGCCPAHNGTICGGRGNCTKNGGPYFLGCECDFGMAGASCEKNCSAASVSVDRSSSSSSSLNKKNATGHCVARRSQNKKVCAAAGKNMTACWALRHECAWDC